EIPETGRFVLVEDYEIRGGGIVREALRDRQAWVRERVFLRNYHWDPSEISPEQRAQRFGQLPHLVLVTGTNATDRKGLARELEARLFADGRVVYFFGIGNLLYGVDADIGREEGDRSEHMRRLAEIANLMLDSGMIVVVSGSELRAEELEIIKASIDPGLVTTVWMGSPSAALLPVNIHISDDTAHEDAADQIKTYLQGLGVMFRPW
ncbi:MAG TPA: adenylyl-sulfate kinase, partial [Gemmatimonadaceae bacterium]|nr:adenylyl-sulfate kinase [Gemmatimonadaceae bacterium]